jgi:hypothetical protein
MSVIQNNLLLAGDDAYNLTRSLRFRRSASAYLNRTFGTPTNTNIWTLSSWVKRGLLGTQISFFGASVSSYTSITFLSNDTLRINLGNGLNGTLVTTQVFRDPSAWYHIVVAYDSTQATSSNRIKIYVNGSQITSFSTATYPSLNVSAEWNYSGAVGTIGTAATEYWDGYMTEVNHIDGQALTPSSFGANNASTGVWQPKKYAGTYGTNGFYLPFSNNASTSTLGNDFSGNGNNWTTNNISLTAGSTYDSMADVPTLTSATAANFAVMNPLDQAGGLVFSEANLRVTAATGWDGARATFSLPSTGKYYWETTCVSRSTGASVGLLSTTAVITGDLGAAATGYVYNSGDGNKYNNGSASSYGATWGTNDIIGISWDADAGTLVFYKNGTSQGTAWTGLSGTFSPAIGVNGSDSMNANFGQRPFAYTPPTGYVALNTFNLPTPTIGATETTRANKYFDILTYTGNGGTQTLTGLNFQPDLVWGKARSDAINHNLFDSVRGGSKQLMSNTTDAEVSRAGNAVVFNSNGITLDASYCNINNTSVTNVAWCWDANGTGVTNTAGSITSTVSANTSAGFSVVTYTGNGTGGATIGHGLGVAPSFIVVKARNLAGQNWGTYVKAIDATSPANYAMALNLTVGKSTTSGYWNNTMPTSSVFSVGTDTSTNNSGSTYVAYCFSEVAGYSKFGSYTGNGSIDGVFVYTGFKPRYLMIKGTGADTNWVIIDTARSPYNTTDDWLLANSSTAELTDFSFYVDALSNGFKLRGTNLNINSSGDSYIYMAFAENPFKYSLAR